MDVGAEIRRAKWARPFRRFRLLMRAGRRLLVTEPERLACPPTGRQVFLIGEDESIVWLTPDEVVAVEAEPVDHENVDGSC
jgi:hypothetical protein